MKDRTTARSSLVLASAALLGWGPGASCGDWQFTPRLSLDEAYTDNVRLEEDGGRGDFVTTVTPGISVRGTGRRLNANVDYNLQQLVYGQATDFNATNHQLQGDVRAEIIEDWIYFDTSSRMSQQTIDSRRQFTSTNRGPDANRRDVLTYDFTPSLRHTFGTWFNLEANYQNVTIDQSGGATTNVAGNSSDEESYLVSVGSGSILARTPMRFTFRTRDATFDSGRESTLESYSGELSYIVNRKFRLTGQGGVDNNTFQSGNRNNSGPYWSVGGSWTPSPRTTLSGSWGDRFFGKNFSVSGNHRHRRWTVDGSYSEDVQTSSDFQRGLLLVPLLDETGQPVFDPVTSSLILIPLDSQTATDDVVVNKNARAGLRYRLRRGNLRLSFFQSDRIFQASGQDELTRGATFGFDWRLSPRLRSSLDVSWRENTRSNEAQSNSYYSIAPGLSYDLGPHTTARLRYEYAGNEGGGGGGGAFGRSYTENVLSANLVFNL